MRKAVVGGAAALYLSVPLSDLDLDGDEDLQAPAAVSVRNPLAYLDTEADGLDRIAGLDRDGGEVRSELDGSTRDTEDVLVSVLLILVLLKASRDRDGDRRLPEDPVSAGDLQSSAPTYA